MSMERKLFAKTQRDAVPATVSEDRDDMVERHPAFGQVMVFKTSGMEALYGSDFPHQHYVSIEVHASELHRGLSRDWPFAKEELIRISMTEAQFVSMCASAGNGSGTQCTISRRQVGGRYEGMPRLQLRDSSNLYKQEGRERVDDALKQIDDLIESVGSDVSGLSKTKRDAILSKLVTARRQLGPNLAFVADSFVEHLEEREEQAKTEVIAWMDSTIRRAGLDAIAADRPVALDHDPDAVELLPPPSNFSEQE